MIVSVRLSGGTDKRVVEESCRPDARSQDNRGMTVVVVGWDARKRKGWDWGAADRGRPGGKYLRGLGTELGVHGGIKA